MPVRLVYQAFAGKFDKAALGYYGAIANASTAAIKDAASVIRPTARARIQAALSKRFAKGLKIAISPRRGSNVNSSLHVFTKFNFLGVFQTGKTIQGKPLIWLPLDGTNTSPGLYSTIPSKIGGLRTTPKLWEQRVGPLQFIHVPGKPPMLCGAIATNLSGALPKKLTLARFKGRIKKQGKPRLVPVFIGVSSVHLAQRLNVQSVIETAARQLPGLFYLRLAQELKK